MLQRRHLLVPAVLALLLGSAVPAVADDAPPTTEPVAEATVEPTTEPTEEPTEEPTAEPTTDPTAEPSPEPTAEPRPAAQPNPAPKAVAKQIEAEAAPSTVTTATALSDALSACESGDVITLGADITLTAAATIGCDLTLDLDGHALEVPGIDIAADQHLTIDDSAAGGTLVTRRSNYFASGIKVTDARLTINGGTITAHGGGLAAGIGGDVEAGVITINGGTITAHGGDRGAGIGGANSGEGGVVTINGGTVTAHGGHSAPGIGGGGSGVVTINDGTVTAYGGEFAPGIGSAAYVTGGVIAINGGTITAEGGADGGAGIGSGFNRPVTSIDIMGGTVTAVGHGGGAGVGTSRSSNTSGPITIGAGAQVNADSDTGSAIGGGLGGGGRGPVGIDGIVRATGAINVGLSDFAIGASGRLVGPSTNEAAGPRLGGNNVIDNAGVIAPTSVEAQVRVTGHHYEVVSPTGSMTVYAGSLQAAYRTLTSPTRGVDAFTGWTHDGDPFTAATTLPGSSTDGSPVRVELDPTWSEGSVTFEPPFLSLTAGTSARVVPILEDGDGDAVTTAWSEWDLTSPGLTGSGSAHGWELTGTTTGTSMVEARITVGGRSYTGSLDVTVTPAMVSSLVLSSTGTAAQGETITLTAEGTDRFGNDLGDVTGDVILTSSVGSDLIDGNEISFTMAGDRTITATHAAGAVSTLLIEVTPLPAKAVDEDSDETTPQESGQTSPQESDEAAAELRGKDGSAEELADTGSSTSPWWLAAALGLVLAGGAVVRRAQRR